MSELVRVAERESALTPLGTEMVAALGVEAVVAYGELTLIAQREKIVEVMTALRDQFASSSAWTAAAPTTPTAPSGSRWSITCCR